MKTRLGTHISKIYCSCDLRRGGSLFHGTTHATPWYGKPVNYRPTLSNACTRLFVRVAGEYRKNTRSRLASAPARVRRVAPGAAAPARSAVRSRYVLQGHAAALLGRLKNASLPRGACPSGATGSVSLRAPLHAASQGFDPTPYVATYLRPCS